MLGIVIQLMFIIFALLVGGLVIGYIMINMRAHSLVLYEKIGDNRCIEKKYKMLEKLSKGTKEKVWVSVPWQPKVWVEAPKGENVNISAKGKKCAHGRLGKVHEKGMIEVQWLKPDINGDLDFQPLNHTAKNTIRNEVTESEKERNAGFSWRELQNTLVIGGILVIIVMGLIFVPKGLEQYQKVQQNQIEWTEQTKELQARNAQIMKILGEDLEEHNLDIELTQTAKEQTGQEVNSTGG